LIKITGLDALLDNDLVQTDYTQPMVLSKTAWLQGRSTGWYAPQLVPKGCNILWAHIKYLRIADLAQRNTKGAGSQVLPYVYPIAPFGKIRYSQNIGLRMLCATLLNIAMNLATENKGKDMSH